MLRELIEKSLRSTRRDGSNGQKTAITLTDRLIDDGRRAEDQGDFGEACKCYRKARDADPNYAPAYLNLGIALAALGDTDGAEEAYNASLRLEPNNVYANYNLSNLLYLKGRFSESEQLLRIALEIKSDFPEAHVALANTLDDLGREMEAKQELAIALEQRPDYLGALYNYAVLSNRTRCYEDAEDALRHFLEIDPGNLEALQILAIALWGQGRWSDALECFRSLRDGVPWLADLASKELFLINYDESLSAEELYRWHRDFGIKLEQEVPARFGSYSRSANPDRRLRVGYVSPDYNWHPVALFVLPVVERHDRINFEIFCYSTGGKVDDVTRAIRHLPDHWVDVAALSDAELAEKVYSDRIDILVDLTGHTGGNRLKTFAQQPAPLQVTWLGYLNTTGLTRIHYRLCDARTDPVGCSDSLHTEKLVRLPNSQWCYRPFIIMETAERAPWENKGYITFGSFNHALKISPNICARWGEILVQVPNAQLICVGVSAARKMAELLNAFTLTGVESDRIRIVPRVSLEEYVALFNEVDIALDTFPYGGGTTTFDALYMGTPVVAATGSTPTSRSAASILAALGLDEWIAPSIDDYVRVAVERANDRAAIAELRRTLRPRLQASPLMDEVQFVRDLEAAYRQMWRDYCSKAG